MTQIQNGSWATVIRQPGYFGKHREARHAEFDQKYGAGQWRIAWEIAGYTDSQALNFAGLCQLYEESYMMLFRQQPEVLAELVGAACNVYDDDPSNVASGFDYHAQETGRTHVQDIAIRCSVLRLGEHFRGTELLRIRDRLGDHPLSMTLSPGRVPFVYSERITTPHLTGWWLEGSVEDFYQSNKVVQVRS